MRKIDPAKDLKNGKSLNDIIVERHNKILAATTGVSAEDSLSFKEVFGDLSDCEIQGSLDLSLLNLNSLEGCPKVVLGHFNCDNNRYLKNLKGCPVSVMNYFSCEFNSELISLEGLEDLEIRHGESPPRSLHLSSNKSLIDLDFLSEKTIRNISLLHIEDSNERLSSFDLVILTREKREKDGNYHFLQTEFAEKDFEKLYKIYKKLHFNKKKFLKVKELI